MIILPQYEYEITLYSKTPLEYRWLYNKLQVAERLGYACGPCGTSMEILGDYCVRPIMNLHGCGKGGWEKFTYDGSRFSIPEYKSGWFWMPWFEGKHLWTEYTNDVPVRQAGGFMQGDILKWERSYDFIPLPDCLKNLSKYMTIESIGGNIVEVAPKHLADNKDAIMDMQLTKDANGQNLWVELFETARSW